MQRYLLFASLIVLSLMASREWPEASLEIKVHNIKHSFGTIWIGIYPSEEAFLDKSKARLLSVKVNHGDKQTIVVNDLKPGDYAMAIFHDLNGNSEMDFNWVGAPTEPFAFSKPVPSKWRLPSFSEVKVPLQKPYNTVATELNTWWEH